MTGDGKRGRKHQPSLAAFLAFLAANNAKHFANCLLENGYHLENMHKLTDRDLIMLRVTSQKERSHLLGLARIAGDMCHAATSAPDEVTNAGSTTPPRPAPPASAPDNVFSATMPTSNERCRQATLYVEHQRIDRAWPCPGSDLARSLSLSTAVPHTGSHTLYTIAGASPRPESAADQRISTRDAGYSMTGKLRDSTKRAARKRASAPHPPGTAMNRSSTPRWRPALHRMFDDGLFGEAPPVLLSSGRDSFNPAVQHDPAASLKVELGSPAVAVPRGSVHHHGHSAAYCGVCEQNVIDATLQQQGQWQYNAPRTVITGVDSAETVNVWEPFEPLDCLVLEHGMRQRKPKVKVGAHVANLNAMMWGNYKIRRVASSAVPFPTLKKADLVHPPEVDARAAEALQDDLKVSFQRLIIVEEERARFYLYHQQRTALDDVLADIADMMQDLFEYQRQQLMAEEEIARQKVVDDNFGLDFDKLWEDAERMSSKLQMNDVRRNSENILLRQQDIIAKLEELGRDRVILEERAARDNLDKLLARFNTQVRALLQKRFAPVADTTCRCTVCRRMNCVFFQAPWQNHWRHYSPEYPERNAAATPRGDSCNSRGRSRSPRSQKNGQINSDASEVRDRRPLRPRVDPPLCAPYVSPGGFSDVAQLIGAAKEIEYVEYLRDKRRQKVDDRARSPSSSAAAHAIQLAKKRGDDDIPQLKASTTTKDDQATTADFAAPSATPRPPSQADGQKPKVPRRPASAASAAGGSARPPFRPAGNALLQVV